MNFENAPEYFIVAWEWIRGCDCLRYLSKYQPEETVKCNTCGEPEDVYAVTVADGTERREEIRSFCSKCRIFLPAEMAWGKTRFPECWDAQGHHVTSLKGTTNPTEMDVRLLQKYVLNHEPLPNEDHLSC